MTSAYELAASIILIATVITVLTIVTAAVIRLVRQDQVAVRQMEQRSTVTAD